MAKTKISEYSSTANSNTDIASINIDEGCAPSGINNAIRALMAQLKNFQTGASGDSLTVGGVLTVTGGSASAPAITTSGDTNTGVLFPAADTVGITTGGTERVRVDSSGNVGVGTTSPNTGAYASSSTVLTVAGKTAYGAIEMASVAALSDGKTLGQLNFTNTTQGNADKSSAVITARQRGTDATNPGSDLGFYTRANAGSLTERMTLDASGNLGVGTTSPGARLDVSSASSAVAGFSKSGSQTVYAVSYASNAGIAAESGGLNAVLLSSSNNLIQLYTNNAERARIDSSGNLGIGLTPTSGYGALQVLAAGSIVSAGVQRAVEIYDAGAGSGEGGAITFSSATCPAFAAVYGSSTNPGGSLIFATNSANTGYPNERMRIDSSGNLLVGTTDSGTTTGVGIKNIVSATAPQLAIVGSSTSDSNDAIRVYSTGAAAYRFEVTYAGKIYATTTTITGISDERLKENIRDLDDGLSTVMALQPRKFDWKEGKGADVKNARGFIAQEFEQVFPDLIEEWRDPAPEGEEPYKAVRADLIPVLVKAIQEQQAIITQLQADVAALKGN